MPSKSKAQHNLMAAVANNPKFAKKAGIPQTVGADYMKADKKVMKYKAGGSAMKYKAGGITGPDKEGTKKRKKGKSSDPAAFPDLNKDGKVTQADVLMGRGVDKMNMGGKVMQYNKGGKIRGYGMARGGKVCKMR